MLRYLGSPAVFPRYVSIGAAALAAGLHAAVIGLLVWIPARQPPQAADSVEIRFVELSDVVEGTATTESIESSDKPAAHTEEQIAQTQSELSSKQVDESPPVAQPAPTDQSRSGEQSATKALPEPAKEPVEASVANPKSTAQPEPQRQPEPRQLSEPLPKPAAFAKTTQPSVKSHEPAAVSKPRVTPLVKTATSSDNVARATAPSGAASGNRGQASEPKAPDRPVDPDRPRVVGKVDYLGKPPVPVYPRVSERRGEQGRVVVRVLISATGVVLKTSVQQSSGHQRLDDAAMRAARAARFKPYTENGVPYKAQADIPFDFVL
jgi:protein TonB